MSLQSLLAWIIVAAAIVFFLWLRARGMWKPQNIQDGHKALWQIAGARGWSYMARGEGEVSMLAGAAPLPLESRKREDGYHVVTGKHHGRPCRAFEYHDRSFASEDEEVAVHSVWALKVEQDLPHLCVYQKSLVGNFLQGRALQQDNPELDRRFHLISEEEEASRAVLKDGLAHFLLTDERAAELPLRLFNNYVITWRMHAHLDGRELDAHFDFLADAAAHLAGAGG